MKHYQLFLKTTLIGSITETNWDMRSSGNINYHFNYLDPSDRLAAFIRHSIQYSECLENGTEELEELSKIESEQFLDFVESKDWYLCKENKERIHILCPIFHENNEITWQTDLSE